MDSNHLSFMRQLAYPFLFQYFNELFFFVCFLSSYFSLSLLLSALDLLLLVENKGVEPLTLCVQVRCSSQLS